MRTHHFLCSGENSHTPVDQSDFRYIMEHWETEFSFLFAVLKNLFEEVVELTGSRFKNQDLSINNPAFIQLKHGRAGEDISGLNLSL